MYWWGVTNNACRRSGKATRRRGGGDCGENGKSEAEPVDEMVAEAKARANVKGMDPPDREIAQSILEVVTPRKFKQDLSQFMPKSGKETLPGALRNLESFEGAKANLWRLICLLRIGQQGCDSDVIACHHHTRTVIRSKISKWQNLLRHKLHVMEAQQLAPALRHRASRAAAWAQHQEEIRAKSLPALPESMKIETGQVVAVDLSSCWCPAVVLSVYRIYKRGSGAQLFAHELARGCLHSCRVVILAEPDQARGSGEFVCGPNSLAMVLPADQVGLRLDAPSTRIVSAIDGQKVVLGEDSFFFRLRIH